MPPHDQLAKVSGLPAIICRTVRGVRALMLVGGTLITHDVASDDRKVTLAFTAKLFYMNATKRPEC